VICRQCGTEIADKAIVCYRCGAATAEPLRRPAPAPSGSRLRLGLVMAAVLLAIIAAAVVGLPRTPEGWPRAAGYAAVALVTFGVVTLARRRFRR
jgi:hypothetical protein